MIRNLFQATDIEHQKGPSWILDMTRKIQEVSGPAPRKSAAEVADTTGKGLYRKCR